MRYFYRGFFVGPAFVLPFLDLGIIQSPKLHPSTPAPPTSLSTFLPGFGGSRVLLGAGFTRTFDEAQPLLLGLAWLAALISPVALTSHTQSNRYAGRGSPPHPLQSVTPHSARLWLGAATIRPALFEDNRDAGREAAVAER